MAGDAAAAGRMPCNQECCSICAAVALFSGAYSSMGSKKVLNPWACAMMLSVSCKTHACYVVSVAYDVKMSELKVEVSCGNATDDTTLPSTSKD